MIERLVSFQITVMPEHPKPGFANQTYKVVVEENQAAHVILDASIANIRVYYKIVSTNHSSVSCHEKFAIDYLSGIVSTKVSLPSVRRKSCLSSCFYYLISDFIVFLLFVSYLHILAETTRRCPEKLRKGGKLNSVQVFKEKTSISTH